MDYKKINHEIKKFVEERNWEKHHSPKNLSMALSVEASELLEIFQWKSEEETIKLDAKTKTAAEEELVDIFYYVVRMCQKLNIDLEDAFYKKMEKNRIKYPIINN